MDDKEYINEEGSLLLKRAKSELFRRYMEKGDIKGDIPVDDEDYCKKMGIQVGDGESASDKAKQDVISQIKGLLESAWYVGFEKRKKQDPSKAEKLSRDLDAKLQGLPIHILIEIIMRIKVDRNYVDPVTLDDHHSPIYLDEDMPNTTQSEPAVERISAGLYYAAERERRAKEEKEDEGR